MNGQTKRTLAVEPSGAGARAREGLVTAKVVAEHLGVTRSFVYEHTREFGAHRLGSGPRAPLRFSLDEVERLTSCQAGRESSKSLAPVVEPKRRRRPSSSLGSGVVLLPIRGREVA